MSASARARLALLADDVAASGHPFAQPLPKYRYRYLGDPCLTTPTQPVASLDDIPAGLIERMGELLHRGWTKGVGLSANQVGACERLCIVTLGRGLRPDAKRDAKVLINPELVATSPGGEVRTEACLSIPGFETTLFRHFWVMVRYRDERFQEQMLKVSDFDAQVVQHELDHLDGRTIVDNLPRQQRRAAERAVEKFLSSRRGI